MQERQLTESVDVICGIAMTMYDDAASIISSGCTFAAGLHTQRADKRRAIVQILSVHKERIGFPLIDFGVELHAHWAKTDPK